MFAASTSSKEAADEAMDVGSKQEQPASGSLDITLSLSGASSRNTSRSASPFPQDGQPVKGDGLAKPSAGSLRGSPAGAAADSEDTLEKGAVFRSNTPSPSLEKMRASSTGAAVHSTSSLSTDQSSRATTRSASLGDAIKAASQSSSGQLSFAAKIDPTPYYSGSGFSSSEASSHGRDRDNIPPRFKARQMRMPYRRGTEGVGASEPGPAPGDGTGTDRWTMQVYILNGSICLFFSSSDRLIAGAYCGGV